MALEDFRTDMERCCRCSACKFIPLENLVSDEFWNVCPSISKHDFHAYSGGGRMNVALSLLDGRLEYTDRLLDIIYRCQMDGACDVSCKFSTDMEVLETLYELRAQCVAEGQLLPEHMFLIESLKREDNMMESRKAERGTWAEGLDVKNITEEKTEIYFHAGCRYCFDEELRPIARGAVNLLKKADIDVGIAGKDEVCCGCRAYEMGYKGELTKYAEHNIEMLKTAGVKILITSCADCYYGFKVLYDKIEKKGDLEVFHISEYLGNLIKKGMLKLTRAVPLTVTFHDPCNLGRKGEPWIKWEGHEKKALGHVTVYEPPKQLRRGTYGVYEPPRYVIKSIPDLKLFEMERNREYAWCCGSGGGVKAAYPDFAIWTAQERIAEAKATGAEAIVTACPWCHSNFRDALKETSDRIKILDIVELVEQAI